MTTLKIHSPFDFEGLGLGKWFNTFEEAVEDFYKTHDCLSDDPDKENARFEKWVEDNGYVIKELQ